MSRIVIDARRISQSTGRVASQIIRQLEVMDTENEYHVIVHTSDQKHYTPGADNFYLHVVPYDNYTFGEQLGLARFIRSLKPDLVHFTMPQQPLLYFGKRVTTVHDLTLVRFKNLDKNKYVYAIEQNIFKFLLRNVSRRSKAIITPTRYVKHDIADYSGVNEDKIQPIHHGVSDLQKLKSEPVETLKNKDFILFVGNAFPHKNLARLIEAHQKLLEKHPKLHLVFAGKKEFFYEQLEQKYIDAQQLHFLGFVSDEQLNWLYHHTQAYVFPSLSEGFGLPGLEAMQYGVPVVSSNATCLPEVYEDAAHYFDPTSVDEMSRAIDEVLRSKSRRETLIKNGFERLKHFSWKTSTKKTLAVYRSVLDD